MLADNASKQIKQIIIFFTLKLSFVTLYAFFIKSKLVQ
jgi:hypothetical protein